MAMWSPALVAPLPRRICRLPLLHCVHWMFASQTEGELKGTQILKEKFSGATAIQVTDISGGCRDAQIGSIYLSPDTDLHALGLCRCSCLKLQMNLTGTTLSYAFAKKKKKYLLCS
uniref:Uncharacterized protein n=1 Tax=Piliocolobus tephrosceles TaxID=591936 RepID=A0A8C9GZ53_9PRIM